MPGLSRGSGLSNRTLTSKLMASSTVPRPLPRPELPTETTVPSKVVSGIASTVILAFCPVATWMMSASSTSATTCISARSEMVRITVPGLFIVPTMAISPSSMLRRETTPGDRRPVLGLPEVVAAVADRRLHARHLLPLRLHLGHLNPVVGAGPVERLRRGEALLVHGLLAVLVAGELVELGLGEPQAGPGAVESRVGLRHPAAVLLGVENEKKIVLLHRVPLRNVEGLHPPGHLGAQIDRGHRFDLARRIGTRGHVAALHLGRPRLDRWSRGPGEVGDHEDRHHHDARPYQQPFLHGLSPLATRPASARGCRNRGSSSACASRLLGKRGAARLVQRRF